MPRRQLVVAIHDVAPEFIDEIRFLVAALDRTGVTPRVFKVIPEHLPDSPDLVKLLIDEQQRGSEIVLHGFSHRIDGHLRGPLWRQLRAAVFAPRAAEFLSLTPAEAERRVNDGRDILWRAGLSVSGFCAPAWLATPELRPILRRAGFRYDLAMTGVADLKTNRRIRTDWIGYMGAGPLQERLVAVAGAINRTAAPLFQVLKVFLHPQQAPESAACRRILDLIPVLMPDRRVTTYGQLVTE
jgi:predicted deacetylase